MDDRDRMIVSLLHADGRLSNRALADAVGLAPSTTFARVRALEDRGIIRGYAAQLDRERMGLSVQALVFVRLRPKNDEVVNRFVAEVWDLDSVVSVSLITGTEDAVVHVAVDSTETLRTTVLAAIGRIPGVVDERTSLVFEHRAR